MQGHGAHWGSMTNRDCSEKCLTHHRLVDRRPGASQAPHTLHVPILTGDEQWGGSIGLSTTQCTSIRVAASESPCTAARTHSISGIHESLDLLSAVLSQRNSSHSTKAPSTTRPPPTHNIRRHKHMVGQPHEDSSGTHHRLIDRCAGANKGLHALRMPILTGNKEWGGSVGLACQKSEQTQTKEPSYWVQCNGIVRPLHSCGTFV